MNASTFLLLSVLGAFGWGCRVHVDKVAFNRLEEGKKFLAADQPFQAVEYFQESLKRSSEKNTVPAAKAYLAVALVRAAEKVGTGHPDYSKYVAQRGPAFEAVRGDSASLEALVDILANHDLSSITAANVCVELGAAVVPALIKSYAVNPAVRKDALAILEHIGAPAVSEIAQAAQSSTLTPELRTDLIRTLGAIGGDEAKQALATFLKDPTRGIQIEAAAALYRLGDKSHRDVLLAALDDADVMTRRSAANAMTYLNETPNASTLIAHLKDPDALVRKSLVQALGKINAGSEGIQALIRVIQKDADTDVANEAVPALVNYGPSVVAPVVSALLVERDWPRRQRFVQVLKSPAVKSGFNQDLEYQLYEFYEKKETQPALKNELAALLKSLEK